MCGLFGWSFSRQPKRITMKALAVSLMLQNDNRGGDSWGWFAPKTNTKRVGIGEIASMRRSQIAQLISEPVVIAHTRKATTGAISKQNCHPFDLGSIVGAHNGMVYNHNELNRKYNRDCTVDSEHIFHHLANNEDLEDIEAYGAILLHSRSNPENPIYFGTFNDGDLAYCKVDGGIIWSSSKWHLQTALQLSGLRAKVEKPEDGILYSTVGTANGVTEIETLDIAKPYVSYTDWRKTSGSNCHGYSNSLYEEDEEDKCGSALHWDDTSKKFVSVTAAPIKQADYMEDYEDEEVNLQELTEKDMQDLARLAGADDTYSLINLNEQFQEQIED